MWPYYYSNGNPYLYREYPYIYSNSYKLPYYYGESNITEDVSLLSRQQPIRGKATWTVGGQVTKCGIPWSKNEYLTVAVGENSPYKCGQTLKIRNLTTPGQREIVVTVVDTVPGYPANRVNLHRTAFLALGVNPSIGVIDIEIIPSPELEEERWGKYLVEIAQAAYPGYQVTDYNFIGKSDVSPTQSKETFEFILEAPQDRMKLQGNVIYNPNTNRITSIDLKEIEHF